MKRPVQADNLVKIGALREEDHAPEEIQSHVALAEGYLKVARSARSFGYSTSCHRRHRGLRQWSETA